MPVQNGPSLPLNKENGYLWLWSVVGMMFLFAIKLSSNELPVCALTTNFLGPRAKCTTQCIHTTSTLILRILPKTSTFYSLAPCSKFCACAQAQISQHAKILKTEQQQNMVERTHGSETFILKTLNKFVSIIFPLLSQNRLQFSHLDPFEHGRKSWSLKWKTCWGCFESKTHSFDQIMLAPL
jgi:hypothetical protein